MKKIKNKIK